MKKNIDLYDKEAFLKMHAAGKLAADVLDYITTYVKKINANTEITFENPAKQKLEFSRILFDL